MGFQWLKRQQWVGTVVSVAIGSVLLGTMTGCVTTTGGLYYWGEYENVLHTQFTKPGKMTARQQVEILERDIVKAAQREQKIAPGVYAQLGLALAELGQRDGAKAAFDREIMLYPESAILLKGMMQRGDEAMKQQGALQ